MELTRLAPSPTGALHLGNARTFLVTWLMARKNGWEIPIRIEDLDGPRVRRGAAEQLLIDLQWLGLDWDGEPTFQSNRAGIYARHVERLLLQGDAYPCVCSRKEVESAASAPHAEDGAAVYPGTCRDRFKSIAEAFAATGRRPAIRFRVPASDDAVVHWIDCFRGPQLIDARALGDFVIAKADGSAAYQLAVVVDDAEAGVTQVIRGDDLVDSTPRQILISRALGLADKPISYTHVPLVIGADGRRLAKRHGDTRLSFYRESGISAGRLLMLLARWIGIESALPLSAREMISSFKLESVSRDPIVFTPADHEWLLGLTS